MSIRAYQCLRHRRTKAGDVTDVAHEPTFDTGRHQQLLAVLPSLNERVHSNDPDGFYSFPQAELEQALARATGRRTKAILRAMIAVAQANDGWADYYCF